MGSGKTLGLGGPSRSCLSSGCYAPSRLWGLVSGSVPWPLHKPGPPGAWETVEQRIEMALELAEINPESIPVNILTPIPNTPFAGYIDKIDEENVLRTLAIFKIACPKSSIRLAGGKKARLIQESIEKAFKYCVDSTIVGNYLTTTGFSPEDDKKMIENLGRKVAT